MKSIFHKFDFDIEELMMNKSFDQLDASEQEYVREQLSSDDYDDFREILAESAKAFEMERRFVSPPPEVFESLGGAFGRFHKKDKPAIGLLTKAITYRIPAYAAGLACVALLCVLYAMNLGVTTDKVYINKYDTVYIERNAGLLLNDSEADSAARTNKLIKGKSVKKADTPVEMDEGASMFNDSLSDVIVEKNETGGPLAYNNFNRETNNREYNREAKVSHKTNLSESFSVQYYQLKNSQPLSAVNERFV